MAETPSGTPYSRGGTSSAPPGPGRPDYVYHKRRWRTLFRVVDAAGYRIHRPWPGIPDLSRARSILVLKLDQIGDVVLTQPLLAALRRTAPTARLGLAVGRGRGPVAALLPGPDWVRELPVQARGSDLRVDWMRMRSTVADLKNAGPDVVVAAKEEPFHALLARWLGAPLRIGYREGGLGFLLTHYLPVAGGRPQYQELAALAGGEGDGAGPPVAEIGQAAHDEAAAVLESLAVGEERPCIVVHPGSGNPATRWPWARFAATLEAVARTRPVTVILTGGEETDSRPALDLPPPSQSVTLDRTLPLPVFAALLARADVFLGNESGPSHLAAAVRTASVAVFLSGNDPRRWGPAAPWGRVVAGPPGRGPEPETVSAAVLAVLDRSAGEERR